MRYNALCLKREAISAYFQEIRCRGMGTGDNSKEYKLSINEYRSIKRDERHLNVPSQV